MVTLSGHGTTDMGSITEVSKTNDDFLWFCQKANYRLD